MNRSVTVALVCLCPTVAATSTPDISGAMKHVFISYDSASGISSWVDDSLPGDPASNPVVLNTFPGESYPGNAAVLDDTYYSARYGWLANGFINLQPDEAIWIERVDATPGLDVYEGGMRGMWAMHSFDPILGTAGSSDLWQWNGTMMHNWYATDAVGSFEATYRVFLGDLAGNEIAGVASDTVTLTFNAIPSPGALGIAACGLLAATRRRRTA